MDANHVDRAVIVQAVGPYSFDCAYARAVVAEHSERFALVGAIDMAQPDAPDALSRLAEPGDLRGVRLFGVASEDGGCWLKTDTAHAVWERADALGTTIVVTLWQRDIPLLRALVERNPDVSVAIDHAGFPDLSVGAPFPGLEPLLSLGDLPSVHVKVATQLLLNAAAVGDPAELIDLLSSRFGSDKIMWGSNWPETKQMDYLAMVELGRHASRRLGETEREAFMAGNSARLWWR
jgi:predicted TIM-barrel fold metal-dependent hydrolase